MQTYTESTRGNTSRTTTVILTICWSDTRSSEQLKCLFSKRRHCMELINVIT